MERERVYGPYQEQRDGRTLYRVIVGGSGGRRASKLYETETAAWAVVNAARKRIAARTVSDALEEYVVYLHTKGNRARTIRTTQHRLTRLIKPVQDMSVLDLTNATANKLYTALVGQVAVDTHRNTLGQARTWGRWMVKTGRIKRNPFESVEPVGERSYGKDQLRIDEARQLWAHLRRELDDPGKLCVAVVLLLGLRASEVVAIEARDVDAGGTILWINRGKTRNARRQLTIPAIIGPQMVARASSGGRLFPHWPKWVLDCTKRAARVAGVTGNVTAHGLRGLHATLKVEYEVAQRDLGHRPGSDVTSKAYLQPGTLERATARKVWEVLDG